jgi:hypothetical protein
MAGYVWGNDPRGPLATRSPALPDLDHDPAAYPSLDDASADLHDPGQVDLAGHGGEFARVDERHPAQNEWECSIWSSACGFVDVRQVFRKPLEKFIKIGFVLQIYNYRL